MRAIVLAAGLGTRLHPVTDHVPKSLIPFFGKPFLQYTVESVAPFVDEIAIVVHHRADRIRDAIGPSVDGVPVHYVDQDQLRGTGDALLCAREHLASRALVVLGDVFPTPSLIEEMLKVDGENVLSLARVDDPENHLGVAVDRQRATRLFTDSEWVDRGMWMLSPSLLPCLEALRGGDDELRVMRGVQEMVEAGTTVAVCCSKEPWVQIGDHLGAAGVVDSMRHIGQMIGCGDPRGSVDVKTADCEIVDSVVFGPGELRGCRIDRSLVCVKGVAEDVEVRDEIRVVG